MCPPCSQLPRAKSPSLAAAAAACATEWKKKSSTAAAALVQCAETQLDPEHDSQEANPAKLKTSPSLSDRKDEQTITGNTNDPPETSREKTEARFARGGQKKKGAHTRRRDRRRRRRTFVGVLSPSSAAQIGLVQLLESPPDRPRTPHAGDESTKSRPPSSGRSRRRRRCRRFLLHSPILGDDGKERRLEEPEDSGN